MKVYDELPDQTKLTLNDVPAMLARAEKLQTVSRTYCSRLSNSGSSPFRPIPPTKKARDVDLGVAHQIKISSNFHYVLASEIVAAAL